MSDLATPSPKIAVVICTHNRDQYLGAAIDSVLHQNFEDYEVVVIDNASTDNTRAVVEERLPNCPKLRYVHEPKLGLNVARNRGAQETNSPIIAYFDDDAMAPPEWLDAICQAFQKNEKLGVAGGKVHLIWPEGYTRPDWLSDNLAGNLGAYDLGEQEQNIDNPNFTPRGLNYCIRRAALEDVGGFALNLDRVGKNLLSNGELFMTELVLKKGWQVAYLPDAEVGHRVSEERLQQGWYVRRGWWQGISECYREQLAGQAGWGQLPRAGERIVRGFYKSLKHWHDPAMRFDNFVYAYGQFGYLKAAVTGIIQGKHQ
ncbi:MAG: glycosyltransferase [Microcoleaceae cyanobacterium]